MFILVVLSLRLYPYQLLLLLALNSCCPNGVAQPAENYTYQYLSTADGLASSEIICLAKDQQGFLWLGTAAGLSRYDGYTFQNYAYTVQHELIGYVNVIKKDSKGRLWIGTSAGLYWNDGHNVTRLSATSANAMGVNDIYIDGDSAIWLATENGPARLPVNQIDFTGKNKIPVEQYIISDWTYPKDSAELRRILLITRSGDGAVFFSGKHDLFRYYNGRVEKLYTTTLQRDAIQSLFPLSQSKIYFDAASTEINLYENGSVSAIPYKQFYQYNPQQTQKGFWYVGTRGAFYFHPQTGSASRHLSFSDAYTIWPSAVLPDNGFMWIATHDGLVKLKPGIFSNTIANDFYSIIEKKNGTILLGANRGTVFERNKDSLTTWQRDIVPGAEVRAMFEDEREAVWMGSGYQGLAVLYNNQLRHFTNADGLHSNSLLCFYRAGNGDFYVAGDGGITKINIGQQQSVSFRPYYYSHRTSRYAKFFSITESPDGTIWMGGEEGLVYLQNDSLLPFLPGGSEYVIQYMIKDNAGDLWMATSGNGILHCRFSRANKLEIIRRYGEEDGLNSLHYLSLMADDNNNIWAGSSKGLSVIGYGGRFAGRIMNFDVSDGFIKPGYSYMRMLQSGDGTIHIATTYGATSFSPDIIPLQNLEMPVYISSVAYKQADKNKEINVLRELDKVHRFGFAQNSFRFRFIALDYQDPDGIRYYYRLGGIDSSWTSSGKLRDVSFENLPHGNYSFEVKALNSKGTWSSNTAAFAFTITAPFWKTWWFAITALLGGAALIAVLVKLRIRKIKAKAGAASAIQQRIASAYKEQLEIEQIINHFAASMNGLRTIDDILWDVAKNCISKLGFEDCVIYMKEGGENLLIQKAAWGPKMTAENMIAEPIAIPMGHGIVGTVALSGIPEIVNDTAADDRYIVDDVRRGSEITVPIINDGEVIGIIDSEHSQNNFYSERHLQVLTTIAALCAVKIKTIVAEQQMMEKELEVLRLNKDFATSQLTALRMQMNPHFIFNALNSVQHYILRGDVVEATKYLSKFSKLQREILHFGSRQFISLQAEIDMLNRYLELEQNRFGESFSYTIQTAGDVEPEDINIPPMMLQPFVENAIWHGLMPKEKDRSLHIFFDLYSDDILLATLRDNGIGRTASAALRRGMEAGASQHESRGMSIVQERLRLLQQQFNKPFEINITDITGADGAVAGTQVVLKIYIGDKKL